MTDRRALSHQGGHIDRAGDRKHAEKLAAILAASDTEADTLTHGFHSYAARMHPAVARGAIATFPGIVLDPFCGTGTVLLEARVASRRSFGVELSPLGVRIAEQKLDIRGDRAREGFAELLKGIGERSEERVRDRVDVRAKLPKSELQWYSPHVLKELAGLLEEIRGVKVKRDRRALEMIFSSIIVKVSKQKSDTAERIEEKRIRKGLTTELFVRKGLELVQRWGALAKAVPRDSPKTRVIHGDARDLAKLIPTRIGLIVSSPPYGGTYDYVQHHARRYPWLRIDPGPLERGEIGARRHLRAAEDERRWDDQMRATLRAMSSVLETDGVAILVVGDAQLGGKRIDASRQIGGLAGEVNLVWRATASQKRPDFTGRRGRREHLVMLQAR